MSDLLHCHSLVCRWIESLAKSTNSTRMLLSGVSAILPNIWINCVILIAPVDSTENCISIHFQPGACVYGITCNTVDCYRLCIYTLCIYKPASIFLQCWINLGSIYLTMVRQVMEFSLNRERLTHELQLLPSIYMGNTARFSPVHRSVLKIVPVEAHKRHEPTGLWKFEIVRVLRKL